jgi:signal transduction histidine kinase
MSLPTNSASASRLRRLTAALAWAVALLVATLPVATYLLTTYVRQMTVIEAEATINARLVTELIGDNPEHWMLQELHLVSLMGRRSSDKTPEVRRVLNLDDEVVAESADPLGGWRIVFRTPVHDAGTPVGQVEVIRSLSTQMANALLLGVVSCLLAIWVHWLLRTAPNQLVQNAMDELAKSKDETYQAQRDREKAETRSHIHSAFLSMIRHELRTPMNGVLGMMELTLDTELTDEQREYVELARQSGLDLMGLIDDILDFTLLLDGELVLYPQPCNLQEQVLMAMARFEEPLQAKGLTLNVAVSEALPPQVSLDARRFRRILEIAMDNAVKFTPSGRIDCQVVPDPLPGRPGYLIQIKDSGIGIPADQLEAIFEPFTQVDAHITRKFGGRGLGLTIARRLVELMGGRIWASSIEGKGSVIHIRLPLPVDAG